MANTIKYPIQDGLATYELLIAEDNGCFILTFPDGQMTMFDCIALLDSVETHPLSGLHEGRLVEWILNSL